MRRRAPRRLNRQQSELTHILRHRDGHYTPSDIERGFRVKVFRINPTQRRIVGAQTPGAVHDAAEIDHVDVLVRLVRSGNVLHQYRVWRRELLWILKRLGFTCPYDLGDKPRLLLDLPQHSPYGVFVRLYVAARRHPLLQTLVPVEEGA